MKQIFTVSFLVAIAALVIAPSLLLAAGDTLTVYASGPTLDKVILTDTAANGAKLHHVYQLVSRDSTYLFDGTITTKENFTVLGVPDPVTGKLPCIQPNLLANDSIPGILFTLNGRATTGIFRNLYILGLALNNQFNTASGQAIQVSADSIRLIVENVVFEQISQFAIGYSGNWDKFYIKNCKFRNMTNAPNQYYVGEALRNENYVAAFKTDSIIMKDNTMLCVSGYATAATGGIVNYYEFSHNSVIYTFKNPFFLDRMVNAKFNDNIFYGNYAGGASKAEYSGGWDSFTAGTIPSIITMGPLDSTTAADLLGHASTGAADTAAEKLRKVEVKNNVCFWPPALTAFWTAWNDTAHTDSVYTPVWMNAQTVNMFNDSAKWPGFVESGNMSVDPMFGATIPGALDSAGGNGNGILGYFRAVRTGTGTTETYGYKMTHVATGAWTPAWPLPETNDLKYTNAALLTGATDGGPIGDPFWITGPTGVVSIPTPLPKAFTLSPVYPNPFNPSVNIEYTLNKSGVVSLKIYNIIGQLVKVVVDNINQNASAYRVDVNMSAFNSGVYVCVLEQGGNRIAQKMMLLK